MVSNIGRPGRPGTPGAPENKFLRQYLWALLMLHSSPAGLLVAVGDDAIER